MNERIYETTANTLKDRISALIPRHPEILELKDACSLLRIDGFNCDDLAPSSSQANWALGRAQHEWISSR